MAVLCGWVWVSAPAFSQYDPEQPLAPKTVLLARLRLAAARVFDHLPDYTCGLSIERSGRSARSSKFTLLDTLRLEVALIGGEELYAWPGARQFEDRDLRTMVGESGVIGTGDFAIHARTVVLSDSARLEYGGLEELDGRPAHHWRYRVERADSKYLMRVGRAEAFVPYHGDLWADAKDFDLIRLTAVVDEVPPELPLREARKAINYRRRHIGDSDFLLPESAEMTMTSPDGRVSLNRTTFSGCRQYTGESIVTFNEPTVVAPGAPRPVEWKLPAGLEIQLQAREPFALGRGAIGDLVEFVVTRNASMQKQVWLPKSAKVQARITNLYCAETPRAHCLTAFQLERFSFGNNEGTLRAMLLEPDLRQSMRLGSGANPRSGTVTPAREWRVPDEFLNLPTTVGAFLVLRDQPTTRGLLSNWRVITGE
jgi:hypothetical protein